MSQRNRRLLMAGVLIVAAVVGARLLLKGGDAPRPRLVVVITIDTLRADAVGPGKGTPVIDAFLAGATHFILARTSVPMTLPAHTSLFTGLEPNRHGVHDNRGFVPEAHARSYRVLAEQFREAGYDTAGFVASGVLSDNTGIAAGFETFEAPAPSAEFEYIAAPKHVDRVLAWLKARKSDKPLFLWVHFFDPHTPYKPFAGDETHPKTTSFDKQRELYAGEVRRVDAALGRLLPAFDKDAVVVLASDHGEGLGDHGEKEHSLLCYSSTLDVLLAVRDGSQAGAVDKSLRSLAAVAPFLRRRAGLDELPSDANGLDRDGGGLVVSESLFLNRTSNWGQCFAVSDGRFTLVESGPRLELFDRENDPGETKPAKPEGHEAYQRLDRALESYRSKSKEGSGFVSDAASPYGTARRPSTSYLARRDNARLREPQSGFDFYYRQEQAEALLTLAFKSKNAGLARNGIERLEQLCKEDSTNPAPFYTLSKARGYLASLTGDPKLRKASAQAARKAIANGYNVSPVLLELLEMTLAVKDHVEMAAALRTAREYRIIPDVSCAEAVVRVSLQLANSGNREALGLGRAILADALRAPLRRADHQRIEQLLRRLG